MASNRGMVPIRGTETISPHGVPADLLDRCLIIKTEKYSIEVCSFHVRPLIPLFQEAKKIISIRAQEESVKLSGDSLSILAKMNETASLRYAMQLISNADIIRQRRKGEEVTPEDVKKVYTLFYDMDRIKDVLKDNWCC